MRFDRLGSAWSGNVDVLTDRLRLYLVIAPADPQALAEAVLQLADDPALRQEFGRRGREWVESNHDRRRLAHDLLAAMERLSGHIVRQRHDAGESGRTRGAGETG